MKTISSEEIRNYFIEKSDAEYRKFNEKIIPNIGKSLGVRMPEIRKFAKTIIKDGLSGELIEILKNSVYYEERLLLGILQAEKKYNSFSEMEKMILGYCRYIDNWALCDSFSGNLKRNVKIYYGDSYSMANRFFYSENNWEKRLGTVLILNHFYDYEIENTLSEVLKIKSEDYYVNMGIAWLISILYVNDREQLGRFIKKQVLPDWVQNKSIQKIKESLRVSKHEKEELEKYKK